MTRGTVHGPIRIANGFPLNIGTTADIHAAPGWSSEINKFIKNEKKLL